MSDITNVGQNTPLTSKDDMALSDRFRAWRNSKIADHGFRRLMARLPFMKRYSNAKANDLFQITAGFAHSQVLFACVEAGVFKTLLNGPASNEALAPKLNLSVDATKRLLEAAQGLKLVCKTKTGLWQLDDHGVVMATDQGIEAMVRHHALVYRDLADPIKLLTDPPQSTETSAFWSYVGETPKSEMDPDQAFKYSELMRLSQEMVIQQVLDAYPLQRHHMLLDIGGGNGAFISAAGARASKLKLGLFDLPPVADNARSRLARTHFADRVSIYGGSFFDDAIPAGADCFSLIRVLYDHDDHNALKLLENVRRSMRKGDTLIIGEPMAGESRGEGLVAAYFGFYLLAMRSGRCRSGEDISALLKRAGFGEISIKKTNMPVVAGLVVASV